MKKNVSVIIAMLLLGATAFGQAVMDRNVIPVSINLNQVLRMNISNGGNIEFVFNNIDAYKNGISGETAVFGAQYVTDFTVSSSTNWQLFFGAEKATFFGVDNPAGTLPLDNVGYNVVSNGGYTLTGGAGEVLSLPTDNGASVAGLTVYNGTTSLLSSGTGNAGDGADNDYQIIWYCGTVEPIGTALTAMNTESLLEQSVTPDRYTVNVLFDLAIQP